MDIEGIITRGNERIKGSTVKIILWKPSSSGLVEFGFSSANA